MSVSWKKLAFVLLFGACMALISGPFVATASSPAFTLPTSAPSNEAEPLSKASTKKPVLAAASEQTHKPVQTPPRACIKAQIPRPAPVDLRGTGFVQRHEPAQYYPIYGHTLNQVRNQLRLCGPNGYVGYTSSRMNWTYEFTNNGAGICQIAKVSVGIRSIVQYPSWQDKQTAATAEQQQWQRMMHSLEVHERGHVQKSDAVAREFYAALTRVPSMACNKIADHVYTVVDTYNHKLRHVHIDYDHATNHGQTQGAFL